MHPHGAAGGTYDLAFVGVFPYAALALTLLMPCNRPADSMSQTAPITDLGRACRITAGCRETYGVPARPHR